MGIEKLSEKEKAWIKDNSKHQKFSLIICSLFFVFMLYAFFMSIRAENIWVPVYLVSFLFSFQAFMAMTVVVTRSADYLNIIKEFREKYSDFAITTDIIVGFPGEAGKEFQQTCNFVKRVGFLKVHVVRYSKRNKTKAASMDGQVSEEAKKQRARMLADVCRETRENFLKRMIGKEFGVLFERRKDAYWQGLTSNYLRLRENSKIPLTNTVKKVKEAEENLVL